MFHVKDRMVGKGQLKDNEFVIFSYMIIGHVKTTLWK